jgi:hypothetical protein
MKIKLLRSYKNAKGNTVFVYTVSGNAVELESYKTASGDFYRETEEGKVLWFTTRCVGNTGQLVITSKGKIVPDMSAFEQASSIARQYGGNFGQELARMSANALMNGNNTTAPSQEPEVE